MNCKRKVSSILKIIFLVIFTFIPLGAFACEAGDLGVLDNLIGFATAIKKNTLAAGCGAGKELKRELKDYDLRILNDDTHYHYIKYEKMGKAKDQTYSAGPLKVKAGEKPPKREKAVLFVYNLKDPFVYFLTPELKQLYKKAPPVKDAGVAISQNKMMDFEPLVDWENEGNIVSFPAHLFVHGTVPFKKIPLRVQRGEVAFDLNARTSADADPRFTSARIDDPKHAGANGTLEIDFPLLEKFGFPIDLATGSAEIKLKDPTSWMAFSGVGTPRYPLLMPWLKPAGIMKVAGVINMDKKSDLIWLPNLNSSWFKAQGQTSIHGIRVGESTIEFKKKKATIEFETDVKLPVTVPIPDPGGCGFDVDINPNCPFTDTARRFKCATETFQCGFHIIKSGLECGWHLLNGKPKKCEAPKYCERAIYCNTIDRVRVPCSNPDKPLPCTSRKSLSFQGKVSLTIDPATKSASGTASGDIMGLLSPLPALNLEVRLDPPAVKIPSSLLRHIPGIQGVSNNLWISLSSAHAITDPVFEELADRISGLRQREYKPLDYEEWGKNEDYDGSEAYDMVSDYEDELWVQDEVIEHMTFTGVGIDIGEDIATLDDEDFVEKLELQPDENTDFSEFAPVRIHKQGDICFLSGIMGFNTDYFKDLEQFEDNRVPADRYKRLFTVPEGCRYHEEFNTYDHYNWTTKYRAAQNGSLTFIESARLEEEGDEGPVFRALQYTRHPDVPWFSLNGIAWPSKPGIKLRFSPGWTGDPYRPLHDLDVLMSGGLCVLRGQIWKTNDYLNVNVTNEDGSKRRTKKPQPIVGVLPKQCRPSKNLRIASFGDLGTQTPGRGARGRAKPPEDREYQPFIIKTDGTIEVDIDSPSIIKTKQTKFHLSGTVFSPVEGKPVTLRQGWSVIPEEGPPTEHKHGNICVIQGVAKGDVEKQEDWDVIGNVSEECRPEHRLVFAVQNGKKTARIDITTAGRISYIAGNDLDGMINLTGIHYYVRESKIPELTRKEEIDAIKKQYISLEDPWVVPWTAMQHIAYQGPIAEREDSLCVLSGSIELPKDTELSGATIGTLPESCHPALRKTFTVGHKDANDVAQAARIDITPQGKVLLVGGAGIPSSLRKGPAYAQDVPWLPKDREFEDELELSADNYVNKSLRLSFDGIAYGVTPGYPLDYENGVPDIDYGPPAIHTHEDTLHLLSGRLQLNSDEMPIFQTLREGTTNAYTGVGAFSQHDHLGRATISTSGDLTIEKSELALGPFYFDHDEANDWFWANHSSLLTSSLPPWLSLDGINYTQKNGRGYSRPSGNYNGDIFSRNEFQISEHGRLRLFTGKVWNVRRNLRKNSWNQITRSNPYPPENHARYFLAMDQDSNPRLLKLNTMGTISLWVGNNTNIRSLYIAPSVYIIGEAGIR